MKANTLRLSLNILFTLCCLTLVLLMFWQNFLTNEQTETAGIQLIQATDSPNENLSWRWFGQNIATSVQALRAQNEAEQQLSEANINAVLVGIIKTQNYAAATIRVNGQQEKVFTIGDELQPGVELVSVSISRVVLNERGRQVQISMRSPDDMLIQSGNRNNNQRNQLSGNASSNNLLQEGFSLANMFDALPVQLGNSAIGIQLGSISNEMSSLSELQDGDVVIQIGETSIEELMSNPGQWMSYTAETTLPVTVMRNGQETTLYVNAFSLSARILPNLTSELMQ
jgi:type II secretory pathway component PulC